MKKLTRKELINDYLTFFEKNNHSIIKGSSLIPENDPSVLFTTAGMHPLVPYLLGEKHPSGNKLTNVQKCIRTTDIESVGDDSHLTFFEMLGNWSLGDYFKEDAIKYSFEYLTKVLNIPVENLAFTVFEGDDKTPKDIESYKIWKSLGIKEENIYYLDRNENFWELGSGVGPCGPCSEMFYKKDCNCKNCTCTPAENCGCFLEIWNDVFMQYNKLPNGIYENLSNKNVDTGLGVERVITVLNGYESVYDTEIFSNVKKFLSDISSVKYEDDKKSYRVIMDHIRTSVFILGDDLLETPNNVGRGYVLRRLIRRLIRFVKKLGIDKSILEDLANIVINDYKDDYKELERNKKHIIDELLKEEVKFNKTLNDGIKMYKKVTKNIKDNKIDDDSAFKLFDTFGFPIEFTIELATEDGYIVDLEGFNKKFKEHQEKSRTASSGEFKGGLADDSYETVKLHTAAHLLLAGLKKMYGNDVFQKGSNITTERLRYDFNLDHKMTNEEKTELENFVNDAINKEIDVNLEVMNYEDAIKSGAYGSFSDKYGETVKVYTIGNISKELCGGPHVKNTKELGIFKIKKEESSSSGVRRIKAVLE